MKICKCYIIIDGELSCKISVKLIWLTQAKEWIGKSDTGRQLMPHATCSRWDRSLKILKIVKLNYAGMKNFFEEKNWLFTPE